MADNKDNLTVYQKLFYMFGQGGGIKSNPERNPKYSLTDKDLIVTSSKEDFERQKLQLQQQKYMEGQWQRVDNELYQRAIFYETTRIASYMDYEAMEFSIAGDTKIATPDGFITIKELADKGRDYEFITYAYDHNLKQVVPAKARNAHYTRDEMTYKIIFDDDSSIIATHGHRFLKRDGTFEVVENLKEGDSMMPFYRKSFFNNQNYNWVYTCNNELGSGENGWVPEHDLIGEWFYRPKNENEEVHHLDFNGKNNNPENLLIMDKSEHRSYHATHNNKKLWTNPEYREKMLEVSRRTDNKHRWKGKRIGPNNPAYIELSFESIVETAKEFRTLRNTAKHLNVSIKKIQNELKFNGFKNWFDFLDVYNIPKYIPHSEDRDSINFDLIPWDLIIDTAKSNKTMQSSCDRLGITLGKMRSALKQGGYNNWSTFMSAYGLEHGKAGRKKPITNEVIVNHKIKSIEPYGVIPVYDLTVPGYKNFATDTIFSHNTPEIAVALDIMSEESCTLSEQGKILTVYSDSSRIKKVLEDLFYNVLDIHSNLPMWTRNTPIREDSVIPLLDGTECTIKDLSIRVKSGEEIWSYAIQDGTKAIVPSKIVWCDLTRKDSELIRVTLDDGTHLDTTPDHEYMLRDGSYKRADALTEGQSLMPFYTLTSTEKKDKISGYEKVFNPNTNKYEYTHRIVANELLKNDDDFIQLFKANYSLRKDIKKSINPITLNKVIFRKTNQNYFEYALSIKPNLALDKSYIKYKSISLGKAKEKTLLNHKVISVVKLIETSDVYCLEAVGPNGEHDRHNFPVLGREINGSFSRTSGVFLSNCKYGDNFLYLKLDYKYGIVGASQLTNIEIERKESNIFPYKGMDDQEEAKKKQVKFVWKDKNLDFNAWEIAHFRLLGDDRKLPYGTSVLEKIRRIWKQLLLAEDAMLVYRVTRAPERRVFKVYVGNIDDEDVEAYVQKVANKFKRTQTANNQTGQLDVRYNTLAVDQDFFVPVRDANASNPIETLAGAANLDQIADIQFIQRKLVTALRIPKPFLGFEETNGDGKNLALQDVRFARTINRIQQSMIQELNKIAIVHLYILGFHDELGNFKLSLNNPSTQGEMLKVEQWKEKVLLYKDLVGSIDGGLAPTSHTWAKKNIFNWSEDEIMLDLEQQRLERAAGKELENTPEVIKKTGFFDKVDKLYGEIVTTKPTEAGGFEGEETGGFESSFGGGFGGEEAGGTPEAGGEIGTEAGGGEGFGEGFRNDNVIDKLLLEGKKRNEDIMSMTKGIKDLLKETDNDTNEIDLF